MAVFRTLLTRKTAILKVTIAVLLLRLLLAFHYSAIPTSIDKKSKDQTLSDATGINRNSRNVDYFNEPQFAQEPPSVHPVPSLVDAQNRTEEIAVTTEEFGPVPSNVFKSEDSSTKPPTRGNERQTHQKLSAVHEVTNISNGNETKRKDANSTIGSLTKPRVHDELLNPEVVKFGPGEMGRAVMINDTTLVPEEKKKYDEGWKMYQFNRYASDMISLHRSLPDKRHIQCRDLKYDENLPDTSVIVIFYNEAWSVLLRTVHSVLDRSPRHLLTEIILVDDFSDFDYLHQPLQDYVDTLEKVRLVRSDSRLGLIHARNLGATVAVGEVLTFLDSHCEVTDGWLEPMLDRIRQNSTNVLCPVINTISYETFEYTGNDGTPAVGGFNWNLIFTWFARKHEGSHVEPISSPTMAGGLFSISRVFFEKLGRYDPGMLIWGGENLELSFKSWMCGGRLETHPCSHVGHVFRKKSPYAWNIGVKNVLQRNCVRLAEVWLDEYKKYYFDRIDVNNSDNGDVSERKELRASLNCKSFDWYIKTVYPEIFLPGEVTRKGLSWLMSLAGEIRPDPADDNCMDLNNDLTLYSCHGGNTQQWEHTADGAIRHRSRHLCLEEVQESMTLTTKPCTGKQEQLWDWSIHIPDSQKQSNGTKLS